MKPNEFINTYSDDILYLYDMREAILSHPLKATMPYLFSASFSRIYCVFMIGSIESMIKAWNRNNENDILDSFNNRTKSNDLRIKYIYEAFVNNGINADEEILKDYLAIKYLRNTIIHSGWHDKQKEFMIERGFPIDSRDLTDIHLQKMKNVNESMMMYIAMTSYLGSGKESFVKNKEVIRSSEELPQVNRIIHRKQFPKLVWKNIEEITSRFEHIFGEVQNTANDELLSLSEEALFFWNLYKEHGLTKEHISNESVVSNLNILKNLLQYRSFMKLPIGTNELRVLYENMDEQQITEEQLQSLFTSNAKYSAKESLKAIIIGGEVYERFPNVTVLKLFVYYLPQILPERNVDIIREAKEILSLFELSIYYYDYIEQNTDNLRSKEVIQSYNDEIKMVEASFYSNE